MYNILVADDELLAREKIKGLIIDNFNNLQIFEANCGEDTIKIVKKNKIDIVLMDINMPNINGLDATVKIKQMNPHTLIIIISGYDNFEYAKCAIENGVIGYLLKPINTNEFIGTINKALDTLKTFKFYLYQSELNENNIVAYIEKNFTNPDINVNYLCQEFSISKSTLLRIIKKQTDLSFIDYLTKLRIEYAIKLLESNLNISINEISSKSGYTSQHYFSRAFKNYTGLSPQKYKQYLFK